MVWMTKYDQTQPKVRTDSPKESTHELSCLNSWAHVFVAVAAAQLPAIRTRDVARFRALLHTPPVA